MERRHFETIARTIAARRAKALEQGNGESAATMALDVLAHDFADVLASSNPRFDRVRFLSACGARFYQTA